MTKRRLMQRWLMQRWLMQRRLMTTQPSIPIQRNT